MISHSRVSPINQLVFHEMGKRGIFNASSGHHYCLTTRRLAMLCLWQNHKTTKLEKLTYTGLSWLNWLFKLIIIHEKMFILTNQGLLCKYDMHRISRPN